MATKRLGKRERELRRAFISGAKAELKQRIGHNLSNPDPSYLCTKGGSSDSVSRLMASTHQGFRSNLHQGEDKQANPKGYGPRVVTVLGRSLGRPEPKGSWVRQAPLPTEHGLLLTLKRGDKVQPIEDTGPAAPRQYATSKAEKRFGKTK